MERGLHQLIDEQVDRTPDALAVQATTGRLTYRELAARSDALARRLLAGGVAADSRVAVCLERSLDMVIAVVGILKAGAGYVPLDPAYPAERLAFMVGDSQPSAIVAQRATVAILPASPAPVIVVEDEIVTPGAGSSVPVSPESTAYVIYTSGSTGRPKGVVMPHRPLLNLLRWHRRTIPLLAGERVLQFAPLSFDVSFQEIFTTLCEGGTLVLIDENLRRDPEQLLRICEREQVGRIFFPFVALQQFAEAAASAAGVKLALRDVITAGEQLQVSDSIRRLFQRIPSAKLHNHYGPTETHVVTAFTLAGPAETWPALPPIGVAIDETIAHLLDSERKPVAPGASGELYFAGACVARGYLNRPDLTAQRFLADPLGSTNSRMYRTGDLARVLPDGNIEYLGRADDQVKIRGHRVELGEIESALRNHPAVAECAVTPQDRSGEKVLVAHLVTRAGHPIQPAEFRAFLLSNLPEPMVPSFYVAIGRLPLTPSGKVDRRSLPVIAFEATAPAFTQPAPKGEVERAVAAVWASVLGYSGFNTTDGFFAVGGTSLLMGQVQRRLRESIGRDIPMTDLFRFPAIGELAHHLERGNSDQEKPCQELQDRAARQREAAQRQAALRRGLRQS